MANEQEGIDIETLNPENEGIYIPNEEIDTAEDTTVEETEITDNNVEVNVTDTNVDSDKELLKKGVNAERKRRKEAERKNKELEARIKALEEANKTPEKTTLEELIESGIDEDIAKTIEQQLIRSKKVLNKLKKI